ncbi:hypothetical protein HAX54_003574, partial [Datura stramonium]|nr:hypothetical protein [Datura stramonium]
GRSGGGVLGDLGFAGGRRDRRRSDRRLLVGLVALFRRRKVRGDEAAAGSVVLPVLMGFRRVTGVYGGSPGSGGFGWQWCCSPEKTAMGEGLREMREKTRERKGGSVGFRRVRHRKKWGEGRVEGERRRSVVAVEVGGRGRLEEVRSKGWRRLHGEGEGGKMKGPATLLRRRQW